MGRIGSVVRVSAIFSNFRFKIVTALRSGRLRGIFLRCSLCVDVSRLGYFVEFKSLGFSAKSGVRHRAV